VYVIEANGRQSLTFSPVSKTEKYKLSTKACQSNSQSTVMLQPMMPRLHNNYLGNMIF